MAIEKRYFKQGETYFISHQSQRGISCFFDDTCFRFYLTRLTNGLQSYQVKLHSYALLPDKVLLLVTPLTPTGICGLLSSAGKAYIQYYNDRFDRSTTLWKGRFRSRLVAGDWFALDCQKYIELAPVREKLVDRPAKYHWSAYCTNGFGGQGTCLTPHVQYRDFGLGVRNRFQHYRNFVEKGFKPSQLKLMEYRLGSGFQGIRSISASSEALANQHLMGSLSTGTGTDSLSYSRLR